ncbi:MULTISPECIES: ABC transporter permease [Streptomyces]|uniref:ABC transporter permease n=1 Tax=Streptomyces TaxID=1883 RepID=UPI000A3A9111|nr:MULTISPECIES: ABC transporter permease [Streptomyces]MDX3583481.1 ABC transporter permease [Streptomyces europaeiscabiei]MDX3629131.1 ABC transporter permease [Streptomyces europaeiscabiei]MDX3647251.1 ABC transporter permease [Streptomyces europaeiscabiei]
MTTSLPKTTAGPETAVIPAKQSESRLGQLRHRPEAGALIGTLSVFVFFAIFGGEKFLAQAGAASWLNIAAELGIIAIPVGLLMIAGELDVSVGSVLAGSSMTLAIVSGHWGAPMIVGIVLALALGLLTGLLNGILVTRSNVPSLVVTLATLFALSGLTLGLSRFTTGTTSVALAPDPTSKAIFGQLIGGQFEVAIFWWIAVAVAVTVLLQAMPYGNWIFAIGGDKESARANGIPVARVKISLYMASGFCAALVGVIQTILYNGAQVANGQSFVFNSIIAVVIGGVLLQGGYGSVVGVVLGTLTFAIVNQGIYFTGWNSDWAALILGVLILAAVLMNNTFRRLALSHKPRSAKKA